MKNFKSPYMSILGWGMFLTGALMFASCADDDIIESPAMTGDAICFSASKTRSVWEPDQTRSASSKEKQTLHCEAADGDFSVDVTVEDGIRSFESSQQVQSRGTQISSVGGWSYKVGAYYFFDESVQDESGTSINFFSENASGGLKINTENNKNNAAVTTSYYWPPVGEMKFFAVAPADVAEASGATFKIPALENINTPTLTYTIPSNVADQKDIMVAQKTVTSKKNNTAVDLQFDHLLAAVQFKVGAMQFIKINSLKVVGVYGGEITFTCNNGVWTPSTTKTVDYDLTSVIEDTSGLTTGDEITGNTSNSMMLVAPQTLPEGAKIVVEYTETITGISYKGNEAKTAKLSGEWIAGKTTTYALNISGTDFGTVEIPRPTDQDAHYIMLPMSYKMGNILTHEKIESVRAIAQWKKDENGIDISKNTSDKIGISLKFSTELTDLQKKGFWTDKRYKQTNKSTSSGTEYGEIKEDETMDSQGYKGLRGGPSIKISNANGIIYLFIEENNGYTDRVGELIFEATLKESGKTIRLGVGEFRQLSPSWNDGGIGVERVEESFNNVNVFPYGFSYDRKVTYTNSGFYIGIGLIRAYYSSILESNINDDTGNFVTITSGESYLGLKWKIQTVVLDYGALNNVYETASKADGLLNTMALYGNTGGNDIVQLENDVDKYVGSYLTKTINSAGSTNPEYYAAYIALSRNRMYELETTTTSSEGTTVSSKARLYKDNNDKEIIEWYLPSSVEAPNLKETGLNFSGEKSVIDILDGTYWSSTAGDDSAPAKAVTFTFNNNNCTTQDKARTETYKVRAVRKKPTTTN